MIRLPHYYTGFVFLIFGTWHMFIVPVLYLKSRRKYGKAFLASPYYTQTICGKEFPLESFIKALLPAFGSLWEYWTRDAHSYNDYRIAVGGDMYLKMIYSMQWQHLTMFGVFALVGVMEVLHFYKVHFPPNFNYLMYSIALGCEGMLFYWHYPMGKKPLVTELHLMQVYIVAFTFLVGLLEMMYRDQVMPALCNRYLLCLQGFWFFVADTITDPQPWTWVWKEDDYFQMMSLANVFAATCVFTLAYCLAIWFFCCWKMGSLRLEDNEKKQIKSYKCLQNGDTESLLPAQNGHTTLHE